MINRTQLIETVKKFDPNCNEFMLNKAIDFAILYHGSQTRESGEPYYNHPLEVAYIIANMHLDCTSVVTALLHDTIEDTDLTLSQLESEFTPEVARLVDGVTKLTKIEFQPDHVRQAENFRKLLLAMSDDIRVLLVKLADRLHNMRTIDHVKSEEKRTRIALETMEIYAPLAERIGIHQIKSELQDIAFRLLHNDVRNSIIQRLNKLTSDDKFVVESVVQHISQTLDKAKLTAKVYGRQKTPYSIWLKMKQKNVSFEQLSDIVAFRIVVKHLAECYQALGIIHAEYQMVPDSFQDFISTPKRNGYQSLHTVVIGPEKQRIEIQIRTYDMHDISELGVAAHWCYKQRYHAKDGKQYRWVRDLLSILDQTNDPEEFLQNTKLAIYYDQVFCFTPRGTLIALPKGATTIDFAYAVHSDIGHHCVGAKINGRIVPLRTTLENGDQVEIITSKNQIPSPSWEKFAITGKARSEIRKFVRGQQRQEYVKLGQNILDKALRVEHIADITKNLEIAAEKFNKKTVEELYYTVGEGLISREDVIKSIKPSLKTKISSPFSFLRLPKARNIIDEVKDRSVPIKGMIPGLAIHYAGCCHPLPGDKIVGVIHTGKGLTIHTSDCEMLANFSATPDRIIDLSWDTDTSNVPFIGRIKAVLLNEPGSLASLSTEIARDKGNISNLRIINRTKDFFEVITDIEVAGTNHLNSIISLLRSKELIHLVERYRF